MMKKKQKYKELVKYGFENELWNHIRNIQTILESKVLMRLLKDF